MNRPIADLRARSLIAAFKARMTELARHVCVPGFVPMACGNANAGVWHYMGILRAKSTSYDFHGHLYNSIWIIIFPLRREGRMLGFTCMPLCNLVTTISHSGPRVPAGTRSSLRPLSIEGETTKQSSGEHAARMRRCVCDPECEWTRDPATQRLRHCERSEAIQSAAAERFWIAVLRSQ